MSTLISDEIEWLRANPFVFRKTSLAIEIDVCDDCEGGPAVRLGASQDPTKELPRRHAPSLDVALSIVATGITDAIDAFALKSATDFKLATEVDEMWDLLRVLTAYQLRAQLALHIRITVPVSNLLN